MIDHLDHLRQVAREFRVVANDSGSSPFGEGWRRKAETIEQAIREIELLRGVVSHLSGIHAGMKEGQADGPKAN